MVKFCFECGAKNSGGKFCSECGTKFTDDASSSSSGGLPPAAANAVAAQLNAQMHTSAFTGSHVNAAAPHVANTAFSAAKQSYRHEPVNATPVAVPVAIASSSFSSNRPSAFAANNASSFNGGNGARSSAFRSSFNAGNSTNSDNTPPFRSSFSNNHSFNSGGQAAGQAAAEPVPSAATGAEAQEVYEKCVQTIRAARGGNNEAGVKAFKQNCKLFGLKQIEVKAFHDSLVAELGADDTRAFVPTLSRLIPDDGLRKDLIEYNAQQRVSAFSSNANGYIPPPPPPPYLARYCTSALDCIASIVVVRCINWWHRFCMEQ